MKSGIVNEGRNICSMHEVCGSTVVVYLLGTDAGNTLVVFRISSM